MTSRRRRAAPVLALCSLLAAVTSFVECGAATASSHVQLQVSDHLSTLPAVRMLSSEADAELHTTSLHQTAELGVTNGTSIGSVSYNAHGVKKGLPATCYGQPCNASACYPAAVVSVKTHVNYVQVTAVVEFSRAYVIATCDDVTSRSCEVIADGVGSVQNLTQLSDTIFEVVVQLTAEGLSNLWWTPTDCSGTAMQILMSPITYDITPPTLAIIQKTGKSNVTLAQSAVAGTTAAHARLLRHYSRKLQYFTLSPTSSSSTVTYGANVVFSFSEAVEGFAEGYAFIKGGDLSSSGLNETVSQQQYTATIVADNTKSAMVMVTGSTYTDLAGNSGAADLNATVPVSVLSTDSTDSTDSSSSSGSKLSSGDLAGIIIAAIVGAVLLALLCCLCAVRRSKVREAKEEERQAAAAAAAATGAVAAEAVTADGKAASKANLKAASVANMKAASAANLKGRREGADLDVKASAPTSVPLRVRFGTGTPGGTVVNPMFGQDGTASRAELPISTLRGARVTPEDEQTSPQGNNTGMSRTDREGSVDERTDSAMLNTRPSGPLIQDPSGVYAYGSGSYEGPIASFPSDAAGQAEAVHTAAATPRARPLSRLANATEASDLPRASTAAGSRAWGDVDLND